MRFTGTLAVTTPSDMEIELVRRFDAPRDLVFAALTRMVRSPLSWGTSAIGRSASRETTSRVMAAVVGGGGVLGVR